MPSDLRPDYLSILVRGGEVSYLLTVRETPEGKHDVLGIRALPSRIAVKADAISVQDFFRIAGLEE